MICRAKGQCSCITRKQKERFLLPFFLRGHCSTPERARGRANDHTQKKIFALVELLLGTKVLSHNCTNLTVDFRPELPPRFVLPLPLLVLLLLPFPLAPPLTLLLRPLLEINELVPSSINVDPKAWTPDKLAIVVVRNANQKSFKLSKAGMHNSLPASSMGAAHVVNSRPTGVDNTTSAGKKAALCAASTQF